VKTLPPPSRELCAFLWDSLKKAGKSLDPTLIVLVSRIVAQFEAINDIVKCDDCGVLGIRGYCVPTTISFARCNHCRSYQENPRDRGNATQRICDACPRVQCSHNPNYKSPQMVLLPAPARRA
jgi:hypothetical protein